MIKIILEIEEESKTRYKDVTTTQINVDYKEIYNKPTAGEIKSSKIIKERIGIEEKYQIINEVKKKQKKNYLKNFSIN